MLLVVPLLSCSLGGDDESTDDSGSPGRRFYLSDEQVTQLERSADTGDVSIRIRGRLADEERIFKDSAYSWVSAEGTFKLGKQNGTSDDLLLG